MSTPTLRTAADAEQVDLGRFALLLVQLGGLVWIVRRFEIESAAFFDVMSVAVAGFAIHYFLPLRHRLPFFLLLSLAAITIVLGVVPAAWLVGTGLALIGLAHLPLAVPWRAGLVATAGVSLMLLRAAPDDTPWPSAIWPILGSMFMFRLIVYMYDLATGHGGATIAQRLSYFFMLPNVCFPMFPVVDFRTFVRTHYGAPRHGIYQVGVDWIVRGIVQLLCYRVVQLWFVIEPYDVQSVASLAHYFVWLYLLYLSISGQFHIIVGMLHLFGFNLPETHRRYYLASSFTDFWRRINIYWKDFMMKVFYYPILFRVRHLGTTPALVVATIAVFALTWFLHAYQGFWIRGFFQFTWTDLLFWTVLCVLVIVNSLYESARGRRRTLSAARPTPRQRAAVALKTGAAFAALCLLWSFWSSESVASWLSIWQSAFEQPWRDQVRGIAPGLGIGALIVAAAIAARRVAGAWASDSGGAQVAGTAALLALLAAASAPTVQASLGPAGQILASIQAPRLNANQLGALERGYYEDLLTVDRFNRELAALYDQRPREWELRLTDLGAARPGAEPGTELIPNITVTFKGTAFHVNRWGMHDKDYSRERPPGAFRIALLGASHVMGHGIGRSETFEAVLEERLNRERPVAEFTRYEILNFAFNNYSGFHHIRLMESKVPAFQPNAVFYVGHPHDLRRHVQYVLRGLRGTLPPEYAAYDWFETVAARAGVTGGTTAYLAERRLVARGDEILSAVFSAVVTRARSLGIRPVYVHMPLTPESRNLDDSTPYVALAARAGFETLDLTGVYDGHTRDTIWIAPWDGHPNALGNRLVADRLYDLIVLKKQTLLASVPAIPH